jgi:hypothetical protein
MGVADVLAYAKAHDVPMTAVKCTPVWKDDKKRCSKGATVCHEGWNAKGRFEANKTKTTPYSSSTAQMWQFDLKRAGMFVIDIDTKAYQMAEEVMGDSSWKWMQEWCKYAVRTGTGGAHFYFKRCAMGEGEALSAKVDVTAAPKGTEDSEVAKAKMHLATSLLESTAAEAGIDILTNMVVADGSSFTYQDKVYKYQTLWGSIDQVAEFEDLWRSVYTLCHQRPQSKTISGCESSLEQDEIIAHVSNIPNSGRNWDEWYKMGQLLYNIMGDAGQEVFRTWSKQCSAHCDGELEKLWRGFSKRLEGPSMSVGTLLYRSKQANEEAYQEIRARFHSLDYQMLKAMVEQDHFFVEEPTPMYMRQREWDTVSYTPAQCRDLLLTLNFEMAKKNKSGEIELDEQPFFPTWAKDPKKRTYKRVEFYPNAADCPKGVYNAYKPPKASLLPRVTSPVDLSLILHHIDVMSGNDKEGSEFLLNYFAQIVQQPEKLPGMVIILYGEQGSGKDILVDWIGKDVLGEHLYLKPGDAKTLFKDFNAAMVGKLLIHTDEVNKETLHKYNDDLKRLVTSNTLRAERKGHDASTVRNYGRLFMTTNNRDCLKIEPSDRRFVVFRSSSEHRREYSYFQRLSYIMDLPEVQRAFFDLLLARDLSGFDHTKRPLTALYREMKEACRDDFLTYVLENETQFENDTVTLRCTEWLSLYNDWACVSNLPRENIRSFGIKINELHDRNIGIVKTKPKNVSTVTITRSQVLDNLDA